MMLVSRRYLRRHLLKLIIFGSLCLGLTVYLQLDNSDQDTYHVAAPKRQIIEFQLSKQTKEGAKHFDEAWEGDMRKKFQEGKRDPVENERVQKNSEAVAIHGTANQKRNEHSLSQKVHGILKADNHHKEPQIFDNLSDKVAEFNQDEQRIEGMVLYEKDGVETARRNKPNLTSSLTVVEKKILESDKQLVQESVNPIPRRKLNNNRQVLQSDTRRKKLSVQSGKPEIRIMPKHPSVPEGHTLMVTCADVLVLARKKSSDEALYMTFELPQSLSRQLKNTVHIIVRPGKLTMCVRGALCVCVCVREREREREERKRERQSQPAD